MMIIPVKRFISVNIIDGKKEEEKTCHTRISYYGFWHIFSFPGLFRQARRILGFQIRIQLRVIQRIGEIA